MAEDEKTLDEEVWIEDIRNLVSDLILYGMIIEDVRSYLLVSKSERFYHVNVSLSRKYAYTVLTATEIKPVVMLEGYDYPEIEDRPYFEDTGFIRSQKIVVALPEEKCRFVKKYGYMNENVRWRLGVRDDGIEIFYPLLYLRDRSMGGFYSQPFEPDENDHITLHHYAENRNRGSYEYDYLHYGGRYYYDEFYREQD